MMKFFRKYNKHLLAVFMAFLMVVFVGGSALQGLLTPSGNQTVATSRFGKITSGDLQQADMATNLLTSMGLPWQQPTGLSTQPLELIDWILLVHEAKSLGIEPDRTSVESLFPILDISRKQRTSPDHVIKALLDLESIQLANSMMRAATIAGAAEIREEADRIYSKVSVNAVVLSASAFADDSRTFSEKRIESHWKKYRDTEKGKGLNFGYFVPVSLNLQYLEIDPSALTTSIGVADLEKKARRFYDDRKQYDPRFRRLDEELAALEAQQTEGADPVKPYLDWSDAREAAIAGVRAEFARETAQRMVGWLLQASGDASVGATRGDDGYLQFTDEAKSPEFFQKLSSQLPSSLAFPEAVTVAETGLFPIDQFDAVEGLGKASVFQPGARYMSLATLLHRTQPIVPDFKSITGASSYDYYAENQVLPYIIQAATGGHYYLVRVVGSKAAHVAESVDEVRDQVIEDMRLLEGYEIAMGFAESFLAGDEVGVTLKERFDANEELSDLMQTAVGVGYYNSGYVERLRVGQLTHAEPAPERSAGPLGTVTEDIVSQWFQLEFAASPLRIQELRERSRVFVVEWAGTHTLTESVFEANREKVADELAIRRTYGAIADWLSADNIRARSEFKQLPR